MSGKVMNRKSCVSPAVSGKVLNRKSCDSPILCCYRVVGEVINLYLPQ